MIACLIISFILLLLLPSLFQYDYFCAIKSHSISSGLPELLSPTLAPPSLKPVDGVTSLCVEQFATELKNHPDQGRVAYVAEGLRQAFHLAFSHNT